MTLQEKPLKGIEVGRGPCDARAKGESRDACGGQERGVCTSGKVCECRRGWTGPHCLAAEGFNDIPWDEPDRISDVGFIPPQFPPNGLFYGLVLIVVAFFITMQWKNRMEGWSPIPDVNSKYVRSS
jgi:hypothetical protein